MVQEITAMGNLGESLYIKVPRGTVVKDVKTGKVIADLSEKDQKELILKGGRGGKGNSHFATSTRQAPRFAEDGEKGKELEVILELKLLADVGLIRFPECTENLPSFQLSHLQDLKLQIIILQQ